MPDVVLTVGGRLYSGWTRVLIRRGIEQVSGTFELELTDRWSGQERMWPIAQGDGCTVTADGEVLITGYVDEVLPRFDAAEHQVMVVGRAKTGDLVDCSAIAKSGEWRGRTLAQVARDIAAPFGIEVADRAGANQPFERAALQEGETAWEALERAARMRGVLMVSDARGGLVITRAGTERASTALVQGDNIKAARATFSWRDRFGEYIVKGQNIGYLTPEHNAQPSGRAKDPGVTRYRPLIIVAEDIGDNRTLKDRALWEAAVRMGRSARPEITVAGWRQADGALWRPNQLVRVRCPYLYLDDEELLTVSVAFRLDGREGTITEIELARPEAFDLRPLPEDDTGVQYWR